MVFSIHKSYICVSMPKKESICQLGVKYAYMKTTLLCLENKHFYPQKLSEAVISDSISLLAQWKCILCHLISECMQCFPSLVPSPITQHTERYFAAPEQLSYFIMSEAVAAIHSPPKCLHQIHPPVMHYIRANVQMWRAGTSYLRGSLTRVPRDALMIDVMYWSVRDKGSGAFIRDILWWPMITLASGGAAGRSTPHATFQFYPQSLLVTAGGRELGAFGCGLPCYVEEKTDRETIDRFTCTCR